MRTTRLLLAAIAMAPLCACAHVSQPPPAIEVLKGPVEDHITTVPCVDRSKIQTEPAHVAVLPPNAIKAADLLGAVDQDLRKWGEGLLALISGCTE